MPWMGLSDPSQYDAIESIIVHAILPREIEDLSWLSHVAKLLRNMHMVVIAHDGDARSVSCHAIIIICLPQLSFSSPAWPITLFSLPSTSYISEGN